MVELGLFQDERVELLWGVLIKMSPQYAPHASTVQKLTELLVEQLRKRFSLRIQLPLALSGDSEPEPDVAVVARGDYQTEHPTTAHLVIEVSDSSLEIDRRKAAIYAAARIPEYWIVNLQARTVEMYSSPDADRYAEVRTVRAGELRPMAISDVSIALDEILPTAK